MTSIVARLRLVAESDVVASLDDLIEACDLGQMIEGCDRTSGVLQDCAFTIANLDTLLTIVERFAATEYPVDYNQSGVGGRLVCEWCEVDSDEGDWMEPMAFPHDPDCPWLLARRACGMEDEG